MESLTPSKRSTALGIAITKFKHQPRILGSRIAQLIFFSNFAAFAVLAVGVLTLSELRAQLVGAKIESLRTQAELIADALADSATLGEPAPILLEPRAIALLQRLRLPGSVRLRLFSPDGRVVADSALIGERVNQRDLPILQARKPWFRIPPLSAWPARSLAVEVKEATRGQASFGLRAGPDGARVVSVSLPIQRVQAVLAVLTVESDDVEAILAEERRARLPFIFGAGVLIWLSSSLLAVLIARPLRRLAGAADRLRASGGVRLSTPEIARRKDEIGHLAQALERLTGALAERIDANARFAADVAHEVKNPLTSIRSAVETARAIAEPQAREQLLAIIAADVGRLDRLISDISRASRLEAETAKGPTEWIDLSRLLGELAQTYEATRNGGVHVEFDGAAIAPVWVSGQEGPLGQVFRNLIDNARSFSPPDGVVRLRLLREGAREQQIVRAEIEDNGPGIPVENLETIFERFYTQRPRGAAFGGNSGLGLSIARQIVLAHKGRIWAENRLGGGARFVVELPLAPWARGETWREG